MSSNDVDWSAYQRLWNAGIKTAASEAEQALLVVAEQAGDKLDGAERDALAMVRFACQQIAEGGR